MGHQGGDASRDIRHANALPVIDGEAFAAYVEQVLVPELATGTVVILDNLATHKNVTAAKAMREAGCWFVFWENRPLDAFLFPRTPAAIQPGSEPD